MTNESQDKVLLIAILEIIFLTFIAIFSIGFISVPNLFIQNAFDRANHSRYKDSEGEFTQTPSPTEEEPDYEGIEDGVTRMLIFLDFFLIFQLIIHTLIVIGFNKAAKKREHKMFLPWFIFNCILLPLVLAGTIYAFVQFCCVPVAAFNHVLNVIFIVYKGWAMYTVFMYMKELRDHAPLNERYGAEKSAEADDDD